MIHFRSVCTLSKEASLTPLFPVVPTVPRKTDTWPLLLFRVYDMNENAV